MKEARMCVSIILVIILSATLISCAIRGGASTTGGCCPSGCEAGPTQR